MTDNSKLLEAVKMINKFASDNIGPRDTVSADIKIDLETRNARLEIRIRKMDCCFAHTVTPEEMARYPAEFQALCSTVKNLEEVNKFGAPDGAVLLNSKPTT